MGSISDFLENELADHVFNNAAYTPPATVYLALSTADPTDAGSGMAEPSGNGYARQAITFGAASARRVTQSATVTFPQATGAWGTITHWAIFSASTGGNMLAHGAFSASKSVVSGNTPSVASGQVYVEWSAGAVSNYLANISLDFAFRNQAFSPPQTFVGLTTATIADTNTGSTVTEVSGGSYARQRVYPNGGSSPAWSTVSGGALSNGAAINFPTPSASWGTVTSMFIADAVSAGNLLFYDNTNVVDQAVGSGDSVSFPSGDLDVALS